MATNPQRPLPPRSHLPSMEPVAEQTSDDVQVQRAPVWLWLALIAAATALLILIEISPAPPPPREPKAATKPQVSLSPDQLQIAEPHMTIAPIGSAMYIDAILVNNNSTSLTGVQLRADFEGANGQIIASQLRFVAGVVGSSNENSIRNLVDAPVRPNQARRVRIYFDNIPQGWNQQTPGLSVINVTGTP